MAQAQGVQPTESAQRAPLIVELFGRVERVSTREVNGKPARRTIIKTPAVDEFTSPGTFEVRSRSLIGSVGETVRVRCNLRGYSNNYEAKGQPVYSASHVLEAVEG